MHITLIGVIFGQCFCFSFLGGVAGGVWACSINMLDQAKVAQHKSGGEYGFAATKDHSPLEYLHLLKDVLEEFLCARHCHLSP